MNEPAILTENTYFWRPSGKASARRFASAERRAEVAAWFRSLGLDVEETDSYVVGRLEANKIEAKFWYAESCQNVYKSLTVSRYGKRSNITALRKLRAARLAQDAQ
jgi:hypothetical protein